MLCAGHDEKLGICCQPTTGGHVDSCWNRSHAAFLAAQALLTAAPIALMRFGCERPVAIWSAGVRVPRPRPLPRSAWFGHGCSGSTVELMADTGFLVLCAADVRAYAPGYV